MIREIKNDLVLGYYQETGTQITTREQSVGTDTVRASWPRRRSKFIWVDVNLEPRLNKPQPAKCILYYCM